ALLWVMVPGDGPDRSAAQVPRPERQPVLRLLRERPIVFVGLGYSICTIAAQEIFFINYALWMESSFALVLGTLGLATVVLGLAEAVGEVLVSAAGDRIGMHRMALSGALLAGVGFAVIPHLNQNLLLALGGIFVVFVLFEMAIVAAIGLFTEVLPQARSVMMSANISAMSLGRLIGALVGGGLYALTHSFGLIGLVTMALMLAGCGLLALLLRTMAAADAAA
ncbi:MAG: MFS transporter, partial [Anaerolineae bacterium]|nr:MFS transporter [Anaerolineae bacterium]